MPARPPADKHGCERRESRTVPFDGDPKSLWMLAAAGMVTSVDVDERGVLSPAPTPSPTAAPLPFQTQRGPFEDDCDDHRGPGYTTPPPKRPPTSPPPLRCKHARAALGETNHNALSKEIRALERDNSNLKKQCRLQENVIGSFCALYLVDH